MNKKEILDNLKILAKHQGFYSNIYSELSRPSSGSDAILNELEKQNFKNVVDLVLYLES